ncbi:hypothetical protein J3E69DRAFT_241112 [Trichoderma sp. SZMC 28015]
MQLSASTTPIRRAAALSWRLTWQFETRQLTLCRPITAICAFFSLSLTGACMRSKNHGPFWGTIRPIVRRPRAKSGLSPETRSNLRQRTPWQGNLIWSISTDKLENDNCREEYILRTCCHCAILIINGGISPPLFSFTYIVACCYFTPRTFYEGVSYVQDIRSKVSGSVRLKRLKIGMGAIARPFFDPFSDYIVPRQITAPLLLCVT